MDLHGILIINKPAGWTSHDVVAKVRKIFGVKKVGHAGTLDPAAQGVLVVMVGKKATRLSEGLRGQDKEYIIEIEFGKSTTTGDTEGEVVEQSGLQRLQELDKLKIQKALTQFKGEITQRVPAYSAVKVKGQRLYQLARRGKIGQIELPARRVKIYEIELVGFAPLAHFQGNCSLVKIRVVCSSGTYTRSLVRDIGQALGLPAYQKSLLRTRVGRFILAQSIKVEELEKSQNPWQYLQPIH